MANGPLRASRSRLWIDGEAQWPMMKLFAGLGSLLCWACAAVIVILRRRLESAGSCDMAQDVVFGRSFPTLMLVFSALFPVVLWVMALVVSHRIAGPAWVLKQQLGVLLKNGIPRGRTLREHDFLQDVHQLFTRHLNELRLREEQELATAEAALLALGRHGDGPEFVALSALVEDKRSRLKQPLS